MKPVKHISNIASFSYSLFTAFTFPDTLSLTIIILHDFTGDVKAAKSSAEKLPSDLQPYRYAASPCLVRFGSGTPLPCFLINLSAGRCAKRRRGAVLCP
ncbi:hypothetical protein [Ruminococcus albus]|uniref:hypothetical protein n=1 Tax=Ruminococcus albus TaxID=1264 RepID=UPI0004B012F9|nr:hypothetical protein [Ruminococcus albus]